jgi:hypothetical protein
VQCQQLVDQALIMPEAVAAVLFKSLEDPEVLAAVAAVVIVQQAQMAQAEQQIPAVAAVVADLVLVATADLVFLLYVT